MKGIDFCKRKKFFTIFFITIFIIVIVSISVFKLRSNRYGLPPLKPPRPESIQRAKFSYLENYITECIQKRMQQYKVVGLSIALIDSQKLVWAEGFGYQNREDNIKASDKTIYNLASVTKVITATAIMQLVEQGLMELDKPIQEYVPEFQIKTRFKDTSAITIRSLLTHHSGLPGDRRKSQFTQKPHEHFSIVLEHLKKEYMAYPPNYVWAYCNLGYNLLGVIIERISGMSYEDYIRQNIFKPLGMNNSTVNKAEIPEGLYSKAYRTKTNSSYWYPYFRDLSTGGLLSSVSEMSLFMRMIVNEGSFRGAQLLQKDTLEQMLTVQNKNIPLDLGFKLGLGWFLDRLCFRYAGRFCGHGGTFAAVHTQMNLLPDHKLGVIVTANTDTSTVIVREIADLALKLALEIKTGHTPPVVDRKKVSLSKSEIAKLEGKYATQFGLYTIKADNDKLKLKIEEASIRLPWLTLIRHDDGWFGAQFPYHTIPNFKQLTFPFCTAPNFRLFIHNRDNKKYMSLEKTEDQYPIGIAFTKKPVPDIWRKRVGHYKVLNIDPSIDTENYKNWQIIYEDEILFFKTKAKLVIEPINDQEAIILCLGRNCHETVRFQAKDGQEVLEYAGLEYKRQETY